MAVVALRQLWPAQRGAVAVARECQVCSLRRCYAASLPKILEECRLKPDVLGVWLFDLWGTTGAADLRHLHTVVWMRDRGHTATDNLAGVIRRACPDYKPEMVSCDAIHDAEQLATMRALPPTYLKLK